jgi:hypothetical protein
VTDEIKRSLILLNKSEIYNPNTQYNIYISNNDFRYRIIGPDLTSGSFARTNIFNNIVLRNCNQNFQICFSNSKEYNKRSLSGLIAHEITHVNIRNKYGFIQGFLFPTWKVEGVADYIANSSSYNTPELTNTSKAYEYYTYRLVARYVIEVKGKTVSEYLESELQFNELKHEAESGS